MLNVDRPLSKKENCAILDSEMDINFLSIEGPCNVLSGIMEFYNPQHLDRINFLLCCNRINYATIFI